MNAQTSLAERPLARRLVTLGLVLAALCALAAVFSGIGYQMKLWHYGTGFLIIKVSFWISIAALVLSVFGLAISRKTQSVVVMGVIGILVGGTTVYLPLSYKEMVDIHPYIHDITTDTENPPPFVVVASIRGPGDHPVTYDGPEVAAKQKAAYPDLKTLVVQAPAEKVFKAADEVIKDMGMEIVDASEPELRIEATATSLLYGFKDDMVVRITAADGGTRVDVRSKSRVGRSDLGQNANRIRKFLLRLKFALAA